MSDVDRLKLSGISKYLDSIINSSYFNERKWLKCFYLKEDYLRETIGYPLEVSIFQQSNTLKSIESSLDIVSYKAYDELNVKKTIWNKTYNFWIPLFINKKHFDKSLNIFIKEILKIYYNLDDEEIFNKVINSISINSSDSSNSDKSNTSNSDKSDTTNNNSKESKVKLEYITESGHNIKSSVIINCIIDIYCYMMTTLTVNMMKGETHISVKNMEGFFQIYNYFYQLSNEFPEIIEVY